jgi:hypothetical protein
MANGTQRSKARKPREVRKGPDPITEGEFKWMARYLRRKADLPRGVRVRWILDSDIHEQGWNGTCDDHETTTRFTIRVAAQLSAYHAWDVCIHELGHVRQRIFRPEEKTDHGEGYGIEHAYIWRRVVGEEKIAPDC